MPTLLPQTEQNPVAHFCSFLSPPSFWWPEQLGPQPRLLEHAPFGFWLLDLLRPDVLVELGTHGGYSYFAFCQAVRRLQLATRCYSIDTWKGDHHAGFYGDEVFQRVAAHNSLHYSAFSSLIRATFDGAVGQFSDETIDLLHIDGCHTFEIVKHDFETWLPKLSGRAVVLFHDTNVRIGDFSVFRFWEALCDSYPHFEFLHGHGLGILGVGNNVPASVRSLFKAEKDPTAVSQIRSAYSRLGSALSLQFNGNRKDAELVQRQTEIEALRSQIEANAKISKDLQHSVSTSLSEVAVLRDEAVELKTILTQRADKIIGLESELAAGIKRNSELEAIFQTNSDNGIRLGAQLATLHLKTNELRRRFDNQTIEILELRQKLAELRIGIRITGRAQATFA